MFKDSGILKDNERQRVYEGFKLVMELGFSKVKLIVDFTTINGMINSSNATDIFDESYLGVKGDSYLLRS